MLNLSALNFFKWSVVSQKLFLSFGWNCFQKHRVHVQAEEIEFQTLLACANLIRTKTYFQFILMKWNITSPKEEAMQEKFLVFTHVMRLSCWCTKHVAQVLHNNRIDFPKEFFRYCSVYQHGRRDVT